MSEKKFVFEDFPVYKEALNFLSGLDGLLDDFPTKRNMSLIDQLQRASMSIVLNIAEGAGRFHKTDKRSFYVNARGSVYECAACFQIFLQKNLIAKEKYDSFSDKLNNIAKQLSALINS